MPDPPVSGASEGWSRVHPPRGASHPLRGPGSQTASVPRATPPSAGSLLTSRFRGRTPTSSSAHGDVPARNRHPHPSFRNGALCLGVCRGLGGRPTPPDVGTSTDRQGSRGRAAASPGSAAPASVGRKAHEGSALGRGTLEGRLQGVGPAPHRGCACVAARRTPIPRQPGVETRKTRPRGPRTRPRPQTWRVLSLFRLWAEPRRPEGAPGLPAAEALGDQERSPSRGPSRAATGPPGRRGSGGECPKGGEGALAVVFFPATPSGLRGTGWVRPRESDPRGVGPSRARSPWAPVRRQDPRAWRVTRTMLAGDGSLRNRGAAETGAARGSRPRRTGACRRGPLAQRSLPPDPFWRGGRTLGRPGPWTKRSDVESRESQARPCRGSPSGRV